MQPPNGLDEIIGTFGDIRSYIDNDGTLSPSWEASKLDLFPLPFALPLSWDLKTSVARVRCHERMVPIFTSIFVAIKDANLQDRLSSFGGCFQYRMQRTGTKLSTHAWGIAIDLNAESNQQGTDGNMDAGIVQVFKDSGFEWGGDWSGRVKDPMHFQFATGY